MAKKSALTIIFFTVFIDLLGFGILIPILPTFASKNLAISDLGIGVIVAGYSLMQFLFNPIFGRLSDKYGRRPFLVWSLLLISISYIVFSFAHSFTVLLISRLLAGVGGSNIGVAQAYISDVTSKKNRAKGMGLIGAAFGLGFVFGPMIGGLISKYGYEVAGFSSAGFSLLAFLFSFLFLKESNTHRNREVKIEYKLINIGTMKSVLKMPVVGFIVILFFTIVFSIANIYGTFSLLGYKHYHFTDLQNGYLFGVIGLVGALVQGIFIRRLTAKFTEKSLVLAGLLFMSIGLGFIPYGVNFLGVALIVSVLSVGTGILQPVLLSLISEYSDEKRQGEILGLNTSLSALARVLGPLWGGISFNYIGFEFPFITGGIFTLGALIVTIYSLSSRRLRFENR